MPADKEYGRGSGTLNRGSCMVCNTHFQYLPNKRYYANQYNCRANSGNFYGKLCNAVFNLK